MRMSSFHEALLRSLTGDGWMGVWQAFVVDLFSPHDGSIDLRVLSECFLESDFVEVEVCLPCTRTCTSK